MDQATSCATAFDLRVKKKDIYYQRHATRILCEEIRERYAGAPIKRYVEFMAGVGEMPAIILRSLAPTAAVLNDWSPDCVRILKKQFGQLRGMSITQKSAWKIGGRFRRLDVASVDFNSFTIRKEEDEAALHQMIERLRPRFLILTDTACYYFKFGQSGLKPYGAIDYADYVRLLNQRMVVFARMGLVRGCVFGNRNAAMFLFEKDTYQTDPKVSKIELHQEDPFGLLGS